LDETGAKVTLDGEPEKSAEGQEGGDPMDASWSHQKIIKEKLSRMKSKALQDMSITISQKGGNVGALASRQRRTQMSVDERIKMSATGRIREELTEQQGTIEFMTGDTDGTVDICVQSISALTSSPSRFMLNVTVEQTIDPEQQEVMDRQIDGVDPLETNEVKVQMSRLERDMQTLSNRVSTILSNSAVNKDQEVAFHDQSAAMNRAATYWPIIRLTVLVVTGFTQANHIVRYMKTHHIGI
jgi:hypothetical protein